MVITLSLPFLINELNQNPEYEGVEFISTDIYGAYSDINHADVIGVETSFSCNGIYYDITNLVNDHSSAKNRLFFNTKEAQA